MAQPLADAKGRPIAFHLTPGQAADCKAYKTLIDLPDRAPKALLGDKAYDTDAIRSDLESVTSKLSSHPSRTGRGNSAMIRLYIASGTGLSGLSATSKSTAPLRHARNHCDKY